MHPLPPPPSIARESDPGSWWYVLHTKIYRARALFRKYWWIVLFTSCVGLAFSAWKVANQKVVFISTGRMMVSGKINLSEGATYSDEMSFFMTTQRELMQDEAVQERAEARVRASSPETPITHVELNVAPMPQTSLFIFAVTGSEPRYPQLFLNAVMQEYISSRRELRTQKSEDVETSIDDEIKREQAVLTKEEERLLTFQRDNNVGFLEQEGNSAGAYLAKLNTQLAELKKEAQLLDLFQLDQKLARDQNHAAGADPAQEGDLRTNRGPEVDYVRAKQEIEVLKAERDSYAKDLRPKHPIMVELDHQIAQKQQLVDTFRKQSADDLQRRREAVRLEIQNTEKTIQEWEKKALNLSERLAEYSGIQAGIARKRSQLEAINRSKGNVEISHNVDQDVISIRQRASPAAPQKPGVARTIGTGVAIGLFAGLFVLVLIDQLDDRVASHIEFQSHFNDRVLAQIPSVSGRIRDRSKKAAMEPLKPGDERHAFAEAFRSLRSSLIFLPVDGASPKVLLVASAVPNEGKSTVATNFAITLALSGAKVLLADGDLRRGELHKVFGLPNGKGLGDVLADSCPRHEAIQATAVPGLSLISRGHDVANPGELYLSRTADYFLKAIHNDFDFVVFDSSPVMAADDTTSLAPKVDAAIFVFRFSASGARTSRKALEMLRERQANVIGTVCNDVSEAMQDYYYYSYPQYYGPPREAQAKV